LDQLKSSSRRDDLVRIGKIVSAHGIGGVVKVYSYAESTRYYTDKEELLLVDPSGSEQRFRVLWAKPHKNTLRLALKDVTTRTQAQALVGWTIWIARKSLPPLEDDTYYWIDLIGMAVYGPDDEYLGQITEIITTGANDVYVVKTPNDYPVKEILLPAISSVIIEVDMAAKRMSVVLPEGLI
jgi:16S rRNA processing protein RimM